MAYSGRGPARTGPAAGVGELRSGGDGRSRSRGRGKKSPQVVGGRARARGRGLNNSNGHTSSQDKDYEVPQRTPGAKEAVLRPPQPKPKPGVGEEADDDDANDVCFICVNQIQHHSVAPCNHTTCHICALRLRALYKSKDCAHCRTPASFVILTDDATKRFEEYTDADITSADENIGIRYTNQDMVGDTALLLRYNCPDLSCDFAGLGWPDLHRHVRSVHHKKMCDLCTRNKKVFAHEHELFTDKSLHKHMAHGDDRPGDVDQTGFRGHPLCGFCRERFYDDDKLYEHCRNKHERCFICDRRDSRSPHYYMDYNALEQHFKKDHFFCLDRECQEKKFVVFESQMDLKAHQLTEHADSLSKDVRRDARLVDISAFDYRQSYQDERRGARLGGGREGHGRREGRGRGRDPNADVSLPDSAAQSSGRDEMTFQRQIAIHSAQSISNRTFGGQLTVTASSSGPTRAAGSSQLRHQNQQENGLSSTSSAQHAYPHPLTDALSSLSVTDQACLSPVERARVERHGAVIERASSLLGNNSRKMDDFRSHISGYNSGVLTAPGLIDLFFSLFGNTSANSLGTLVREVADLFEDQLKSDALRKAWQDWRAINEDYPSLPGLGGLHSGSASSGGWAAAASAGPTLHRGSGAGAGAREGHTTRVLKLKSSTQTRPDSVAGATPAAAVASADAGPSRTQWSGPSRTQATAASSSTAFPALPSLAGSPTGAGNPRPLWIGGAQPAARSSAAASDPQSLGSSATASKGAGGGESAAKGADAFPALPAAPKVQTRLFGHDGGRGVRRDLVNNRGTGFSWGGGGQGSGQGSGHTAEAAEAEVSRTGGGNGKKKGKKVLVAWG